MRATERERGREGEAAILILSTDLFAVGGGRAEASDFIPQVFSIPSERKPVATLGRGPATAHARHVLYALGAAAGCGGGGDGAAQQAGAGVAERSCCTKGGDAALARARGWGRGRARRAGQKSRLGRCCWRERNALLLRRHRGQEHEGLARGQGGSFAPPCTAEPVLNRRLQVHKPQRQPPCAPS